MPKALVPLAPGCEDLEAVSIIDVLRRGGVEVVTAGTASGPVRGARGVVFHPDAPWDEAASSAYDLVALPGGQPCSDRLRDDPRVLRLLRGHWDGGGWVGAVCAAPRVLASAGILSGRRATCYPGALDHLAHGAELVDAAVVRDGRLITGRSAGVALDFGLALVEALLGPAAREATEARLERGGNARP